MYVIIIAIGILSLSWIHIQQLGYKIAYDVPNRDSVKDQSSRKLATRQWKINTFQMSPSRVS